MAAGTGVHQHERPIVNIDDIQTRLARLSTMHDQECGCRVAELRKILEQLLAAEQRAEAAWFRPEPFTRFDPHTGRYNP